MSKTSEEEVSPLVSGMNFRKLNGTNYRAWVMRMEDYLLREGLWHLTIGREQILKELKEENQFHRDYQKKVDKYLA